MWKIKGNIRSGVLGYVFPKENVDLPEYNDIISKKYNCIDENSMWKTYDLGGVFLSIYRKRFTIYRNDMVSSCRVAI